MKDGQKITFRGEGDQEPGLEPGDIIIILDEKPNETFRRRGNDLLIMACKIELVEALCGFQKIINTLDKREIVIMSHPGKSCRKETQLILFYSEFMRCGVFKFWDLQMYLINSAAS